MGNIKLLFIIYLLMNYFRVIAQQSNSNALKGIWYSDAERGYLKVFKDKNIIYSITDYTTYNNRIEISKYYYGFSDKCPINSIKDLGEKGSNYFEVSDSDFEDEASKRRIECLFISFVNDRQYFFYGDNPEKAAFFSKLDKLPVHIEKALNKWIEENDNPNRKAPLKKKTLTISSPQSYFYTSTSDSTKRKAYLIKGDKATLLEEKNNWYYIEYKGTKTITGWIKKETAVLQ